jgi:hypothetical protein
MKHHITNTNNPVDFPNKTKQEMFVFLDAIRESGGVNMFEGGRLIQDVYGIDKHKAREVVLEWMQTFSKRHPVVK